MVAAFSGCAYINGSSGPEGPRGEQGIQGEKGDTGETPVITAAEDTPLSYKLHFQTSEQELTTPNLFAPFTEYHVDLSAADITLNIPLRDLILTYQRASASRRKTPPRPFWSTCAERPSTTAARSRHRRSTAAAFPQTLRSTAPCTQTHRRRTTCASASRIPSRSSGRCVRSIRSFPRAAHAAPSASSGASTTWPTPRRRCNHTNTI